MTTTILGTTGKLGSILATYARHTGAGWRTQARGGAVDVCWSGAFDDPELDNVFQRDGTIINMIGGTGGDTRTLYATNVCFVQNLLMKAAHFGVAHVMLASSAAVYGPGSDAPFVEDDPLRPITSYGNSKVAMETVAAKFSETNDTPAITILRIGNVAGADALTMAANRHIKAGIPMPLHRFPDGTAPVRSYIGPRDLFCALRDLSALRDGRRRTVNITHPQPVTFDTVLTGYRTHVVPDLEWVDTPAPGGTPHTVTLSAAKLQNFAKLISYENPADMLGRQVAEYLAL